jgi:uncharacterized membrane protein
MKLISKIVLAVILLVYLFFGLKYCKKQGFWHDEMYTLTFLKGFSIYPFEGSIWSKENSIYDVNHFKNLLAQDNFYSNFSTQILHEGHPPLYFVLLKLWSYPFGYSEVALRSFSLSCGLLSFLVIFNLFRRGAKQTYSACGVLMMLILNPFLFYYFTEARMYALSFLLATLSFSNWLDYQKNRKLKSFSFLYFCLSSIGLLYTHYYGVFFLSTLAFVELLKIGFKRTLWNHIISLVCFLPWGMVIKKQLSLYDVHWTDGVISFADSVKGYLNGITQLLISPNINPLLYELVILIIILSLLIVYLFINDWQFTSILLSATLIYGLQIYFFDQVVEHHTILVSRYYIFSLIFIYWGIFKLIDESNKAIQLFIPLSYSFIASIVLFQLYKLDRAPKQMFREVASFVDSQFDPKKRKLVFEPQGPLMVGVAYYLNNNFKLVSENKAPAVSDHSAVFIDEMLGLSYCENKFHREDKKKLELIPFVGVFLYE